MAMKTITIGYHALIRAASKKDVRLSFDGDGPYHDVRAVCVRGHRVSQDPKKDEPGEYALRGTTTAGNLFLSLLVAGAL